MITDTKKASQIIQQQGSEFAVIKNLQSVFPEYDIVPLAKKNNKPMKNIDAIVMDMDGTTTTTEVLCLFSLQLMIRKMSGNNSFLLDKKKDYTHIIGNSTTKHVEYLINKYKYNFNVSSIRNHYLEAVAWTLAIGEDENRKVEIINTLKNLGLQNYINELKNGKLPNNHRNIDFHHLKNEHLVLIGVDIYYKEYHLMLHKLKNKQGDKVRKQIFGTMQGDDLIVPMQGISMFIPLIKGWLGNEVIHFTDLIIENCGNRNICKTNLEKQLISISEYFEQKPAKLALVTSSILYEAKIVLSEVFTVIRKQIDKSTLSEEKKKLLMDKLFDYNTVYDTIVTASDSNEIRLKPHRDLYSIALSKMGISKERFAAVAGFEDSESGVTAIRAAGIGLCIAVPFADTSGHNLHAAAYMAKNGIPQVLAEKNMFLDIAT